MAEFNAWKHRQIIDGALKELFEGMDVPVQVYRNTTAVADAIVEAIHDAANSNTLKDRPPTNLEQNHDQDELVVRKGAFTVDGKKIKRVRIQKMMRQADVAKAAKVQPGTISRIETGYHTPQIPTLKKIADALGCDPEDFIIWND